MFKNLVNTVNKKANLLKIGKIMEELKDLRQKINQVDKEMARLFEERMSVVKEIAFIKRQKGISIYDKGREDEIIEKNSQFIADETIREYYVNFLKDNMKVSKSYQSRVLEGMKVAYSGTEGAFAHLATIKLFPYAKAVSYPNFQSAYDAVVNGDCEVAVLPVENSYNGEVGQVMDLAFFGSLYINGTYEMPITQDLLGVKGATIADIKKVLSHPQALGQCANYIKEKGFSQTEYENTALAAKYIAEKGDKSLGAIASAEAAEIFGLSVLERNVNASRNNTTKFAIFSRVKHKRDTSEKNVNTALTFTVKNEAGALARAIEVIGKHGFNMRCLRSRPVKDLLWQYYFYIEAEGNVDTPDGKVMLDELKEFCDKVKTLGTFTH